MTNMTEKNPIQKLKDHLKVLFQFDSAELDFGIYRIMNYKRKEMENFIETDLIEAVDKEFEKYKTTKQEELKKQYLHFLHSSSRQSTSDCQLANAWN